MPPDPACFRHRPPGLALESRLRAADAAEPCRPFAALDIGGHAVAQHPLRVVDHPRIRLRAASTAVLNSGNALSVQRPLRRPVPSGPRTLIARPSRYSLEGRERKSVV